MNKFQKLFAVTCFVIFVAFLTDCQPSSNKEEKTSNSPLTSGSSNYSATPDYARPEVKNDIKNPPANSKSDSPNVVSGDLVSRRIYADYGAVLKARNGSTPPPTMIFANENDCANWQATVGTQTENIDGISIQLQISAMKDLQSAREEAKQNRVDITPRGSDAARRSYSDTVRLWTSRVNPGLEHWVNKGRLDSVAATRIRSLSQSEQIGEILKLESQGMNFSTDFSKSILYSVAAPGSSQHLSMLALDVNQHDNSKVREILARHGWFQTVVSDLPHFTYLGVSEDKLTSLGLRKKSDGGRTFWTP
jgi:hypothetical protein